MPYIIGMKKDFLQYVNVDTIGDVIIIDIDSGDYQVVGYTENICIFEETTSVIKHASEKLEKVAAIVWNRGSKSGSIDLGSQEKQKPDVASVDISILFLLQVYDFYTFTTFYTFH